MNYLRTTIGRWDLDLWMPGPVASGLYFVRARTERGEVRAARLVVVP